MEKQISPYKKGLLVLLAIQMAFFLAGCTEIKQPRRYDELKNFKTLSIKQLYPEALNKALEWQSDAYLHLAIIQIRHIEDITPLQAYFVFLSISKSSQYLRLIMIENKTGYDFEITPKEYSKEKTVGASVDPDDISLDTFDAFQIAFENGGQSFFERFNDPDMPLLINLNSGSQSTGGAYWAVSFSDLNYNNLHIFINVKEGNIFEVEEFYSDE